MSDSHTARRRALISVSDKKGLVPFAEALVELSFELVSTGGTAALLRDAGLTVTSVSDVTGFPEIMDGRIKTLHPAVHGGLLGRRGIDDEVAAKHGISLIDLVVVNLYPFEQVITNPTSGFDEAIENIDIGGPAMLRAAAKNHSRVTVVVSAADYGPVIDAFRAGEPPSELRLALAAKAFAHTAAYDAAITNYLRVNSGAAFTPPERLLLSFNRTATLRYGENPHQRAAVYKDPLSQMPSVVAARQLQGKDLSFNNLVDADAALRCVRSWTEPACVIVKHANPCGVALGSDASSAYERAYACDPSSAFGGVIAFNQTVDKTTATQILDKQFAEVIVAPKIDPLALDVFAHKPNIRVLEIGALDGAPDQWETKSLAGGILLQDPDLSRPVPTEPPQEFRVVSKLAPSAQQLSDLRFAWAVVQQVKSNAIVFARAGQSIGIGAGQPSRIMSTRIAALKAQEAALAIDDAVMASDAFFPFRDGIDAAAEYGITAIVQPGGSLRDDEVIAAADELGIAMVFTGVRHFKH
jgi:phosphoribosylaminoimidazolecarboxamide formyltransferase/IMP cyclohydrolase